MFQQRQVMPLTFWPEAALSVNSVSQPKARQKSRMSVQVFCCVLKGWLRRAANSCRTRSRRSAISGESCFTFFGFRARPLASAFLRSAGRVGFGSRRLRGGGVAERPRD